MGLSARVPALLCMLLAVPGGDVAAQCFVGRRGGIQTDGFEAHRACQDSRERFAKLFGGRAAEVRIVISRDEAITAGISKGAVNVWFPSSDTWEDVAERLGFRKKDLDNFVSDQWHNTLPHEIAHLLLTARLFPAGMPIDSTRYGTPLPDWFDEAVAIWSEPDSMVTHRLYEARAILPRVNLTDILDWEHPRARPDSSEDGFILTRLRQRVRLCAPARCLNPANLADTLNIYTRVRSNGKMLTDTLDEESPRVKSTRELSESYAKAIGLLAYVHAMGGVPGVVQLEKRLRANFNDPNALAGLPGLPARMAEVEPAWKSWLATASLKVKR